ncbi:MAG: trypsin-like peptidase domain-containing protein [Candidatus Riflebacteria bacterium]|nr:trypsin-like peptidase domain-containing protein [Candidatus Riflebacteria bacterium]
MMRKLGKTLMVLLVLGLAIFISINYRDKFRYSAIDPTRPKAVVNPQQVISKVKNSIVVLWASQKRAEETNFSIIGCGLIIDASGHVLTSALAVPNAGTIESLQASDLQGNKYDATIISTDNTTNATLLRLSQGTHGAQENFAPRFQAAPYGNSDQLNVGEEVIVVGGRRTPSGWELTLKEGKILNNSQALVVSKNKYLSLIQTNLALLSEDNSGLLVNLKGEVIGLALPFLFSENSIHNIKGISYAMPINQCNRILADLPGPVAASGTPVVNTGGATVRPVNAPFREKHDNMSRKVSFLETLAVLLIFTLLYYLVYNNAFNRVLLFLTGAIVIVLIGKHVGFYDQEKIGIALTSKIDVLCILVGMSLIAGVLEIAGLFDYLAKKISLATGGNKWQIMLLFCFVTYMVSLVINNLTTIMVIAPMILRLSKCLNFDPKPFLISIIIASNLGGASTMIGDFPNMLIGSEAGVPFVQFIYYMLPICLFELIVFLIYLRLFHNRLFSIPKAAIEKAKKKNSMKIKSDPMNDDPWWDPELPELPPGRVAELETNAFLESVRRELPEAIKNPRALRRGLMILGIVIVGFHLGDTFHQTPAHIALVGGALALLFGSCSTKRLLKKINFSDLIFFSALFVLVGAAEASGLTSYISETIIFLSSGNILLACLVLMWMAAFVTCFLNAGPSMALFLPIVQSLTCLAPHNLYWWSLSLGVCAGSSATLTGATAGGVAATMLDDFIHTNADEAESLPESKPEHEWSHSGLTFKEFAKWGFPAMLMFLTFSTIHITLIYFW